MQELEKILEGIERFIYMDDGSERNKGECKYRRKINDKGNS